ncbi:hypothetical protein HO173_003134 [Letharia columbiana]|uniref:Uncharacterized protein n=1 Tax=Letharia columbiana TaxID=112416 RepID=A0A8H6G167_9LECA|nr:uncharacterized protein HO173_003134 [Letharia columbiana]KAF6238628.1 hypothetical protein HO173_003134 [Letharia columbiana]
MAHRGPLREMFGLLCMAVILPKVEKIATPVANTGYIIDTIEDNNIHSIMVSPVTTPPTTGFLSLLISLFTTALAVLGDELINVAAIWMLTNGLLPSLRIIKRLVTWTGTSIHRLFRAPRHVISGDTTPEEEVTNGDPTDGTHRSTPSQTTSAGEDDEDEWFDTQESRPSPGEIPDNTPLPPTNDQALADLRAESAGKDAEIAMLAKAVSGKSDTIVTLDQRSSRLMGNLRATLDPQGLYPSRTDVVAMANDLTLDFNRVSRKLERKKEELQEAVARQESGQLAAKDKKISKLSLETTRLSTRSERLERELRLCLEEAERNKESAGTREAALKERTLAAESAVKMAISQRQHDVVRDQLDGVVGELSDAINTQGRLNTELQAERARTQELQTMADNGVEARRHSETLLDTATRGLQLANDNIANFEREALAINKKVFDAEERVWDAERCAAETATTVTELEQKLQEAEESKESGAEVTAAGNVSNQDSTTEISNLRLQLELANKEASGAFQSGYLLAMSENAPSDQSAEAAGHNLPDPDQQNAPTTRENELFAEVQTLAEANKGLQRSDSASEARANKLESEKQELLAKLNALKQRKSARALNPEDEPLFQQGHEKAVANCEREARDLIANAVRQEVAEGEERWKHREAGWQADLKAAEANFNVAVENAAVGRVHALQEQLNRSVQRAIQAENKVNNPDGELREAREMASTAYDGATKQYDRAVAAETRANEAEGKVQEEHDRAQAAEAEVEKYKKGKASQDGRIKQLNDALAAATRSNYQDDWKAVEAKATEKDLIRARALILESLKRHYCEETRVVLRQLINANDRIDTLKSLLKDPAREPNQMQYLTVLLDGEVMKEDIKKLHAKNRQVLTKQCAGVNAKYMELNHIIKRSSPPDTKELLIQLFKDRGDEMARWDMEGSDSEPESDEDEDINVFNRPRKPSSRPIGLPPPHRFGRSLQTGMQYGPMPSDPNSDNPLKRKGNLDAGSPDESTKRPDTRKKDLRPTGSPFGLSHPRGSSSPEADEDENETKAVSQVNLPSADRLGEATASQQQSNNQPHVSPQLLGPTSSPIQRRSPIYTPPALWSGDSSQAGHNHDPKPTKIPGPMPTSNLTSSERKERLVHEYDKAAPAQEAAASTAGGPTGFSFSVPRDVASVVVTPAPAQPNHKRVFKGLSLLGAAMADKDSALPGLPPLEEDEVYEFEGQVSDSELDDGFLAHTVSDDEDDDEAIWESALYPEDRDDDLNIDLHAHTPTDNRNDTKPSSTVRALDMTEQNYEEQAAEAAASMQGIQQNAPEQQGRPQTEEPDTFHIDLD